MRYATALAVGDRIIKRHNSNLASVGTKKDIRKAVAHSIIGMAADLIEAGRMEDVSEFTLGAVNVCVDRAMEEIYVQDWDAYTDGLDEVVKWFENG